MLPVVCLLAIQSKTLTPYCAINVMILENRVNIDNYFIKCLINCIDIVNGPTWSRWERSVYCVQR